MHRLFPLFAVLLVAPLFGSDSPKEYDDKTECASIEGTWRLIEWKNIGGTEKADRLDYEVVLTFRSGTYTEFHNDTYMFQGNYRIDTVHNPLQFDGELFTNRVKSHTGKCIYQIDGSTLKIALLGDAERPKGFKGDNVWVFTYKRLK